MRIFLLFIFLLSIPAFGQYVQVPSTGSTTPLGTGNALSTGTGIKSIATGANINFADDGTTITISAVGGGGGGHNPVYHTVTGGDVIAKGFAIGYVPATPVRVIFDINVGPMQVFGVDYTIAGGNISWNGFFLDGVIAAGDIVRLSEF